MLIASHFIKIYEDEFMTLGVVFLKNTNLDKSTSTTAWHGYQY